MLLSAARKLGPMTVLAIAMSSPAQTATRGGGRAPDKLPSYDVATIRINASGSDDSDVWVRPTTFQTKNVKMNELLQMAFNVRRSLIFGVPAWAESARFDINAKITDADPAQLDRLTPEQHRLVFQRFLVERFALKSHLATKTVSTYELMTAKNGSRLKKGAHCGEDDDSTSLNNGTDLTATCVRMRIFTDLLSNQLDRPVVDKTSLLAHYDFHLKWTKDETRTSADNGSDVDTPPLFTAIEEQLGLKLISGKDAVETLVIDQLSPPPEN